MRTHFLIVLSIFVFFVVSCTSDVVAPTFSSASVAGNWKTASPIVDILGHKSYTVGINISLPDSSYIMFADRILPDTNQIFNQNGHWRIAGDSICLSGDSAQMLDTLGDTLIAIPDSIAHLPMNLNIVREQENIWPVSMSDLGTVIDAMPMNAGAKNMAKMLNLDLIR